MRKFLCYIIFVLMAIAVTSAQTVTLFFTARDADDHHVQLDRVTVTNQTKGWQETLTWPDTTLTLQNETGITESIANENFGLSQNNPNPFNGTTDVNLMVTNAEVVTLEITDVKGRTVVDKRHFASLSPGLHQFHIVLSNIGIYVMTARQNGKKSSIKMINNGGSNKDDIEYTGMMCTTLIQSKYTTTQPFTFGDRMEYVGYATINETEVESQHITLMQGAMQTFVLRFDTSQEPFAESCPGVPTITDADGNVYHTVQIGEQCWMKENLRTTKYADNTDIPQGTTISCNTPYWYYPNHSSSNKTIYGLLYNWKAVMRNSSISSTNPSGVQGICPDGWHVPSQEEWIQLTDYVSSQIQYVCGEDSTHIAKALARTIGWNFCTDTCAVGNDLNTNNATGFGAVPSGYYNGACHNFGQEAIYWTTSAPSGSITPNKLSLRYNSAKIYTYTMGYLYCEAGLSVRCLRD